MGEGSDSSAVDRGYHGTIAVELTEDDQETISRLAERRGSAQRRAPEEPSPTTFKGFDSLERMEYVGFAGEYAFAKCYNLKTPHVPRSRLPEGDVGYDFVIRVGDDVYRVDTKTTDQRHGNLLDRQDHAIEADLYFLCVLVDDTVKIRGYVTAEELRAAPVKREGMTYPCRYIPSHRLHDCFQLNEVEEVRMTRRERSRYSGADKVDYTSDNSNR